MSMIADKIVFKLAYKKAFKPMIIIGLSSLSYGVLAQTFQIQDFSDDYYAVINTIDDEGYESNSVISIIDSKTKQTLIRQPSSIDIKYELADSQQHQLDKKISANIVNAPYGEHSVLIYDDFNFDQQKDIALKDGNYGCYGGPSYQVYLKEGDNFVHSAGFTDLTQGYCGFFGIDKETQTLNTMTKSGAAWHQYSKYKVIDNEPVAVHIIEEEYNSKGLISIKESTRVKGKMQVENYEVLPPYVEQATEVSPPYIYRLIVDNEKQMVLNSYYKDGGEQLYYAFADEEDRIELLYEGSFVYDKAKKTLSFTNRPVVYQINDKGITVKLPNQTVLLKAQPNSARGSLDNLDRFENVRIR